MSLKFFNKIIKLNEEKPKGQIICQLVKGSLQCKLASIDSLEQKVSFNLAETADFLNNLQNNQNNESQTIRIKLADKYYKLKIEIKNKQEICINFSKNKAEIKSISHLGLNKKQLTSLKKSLSSKKGLIIISGPEESGKSTTYYSLLKFLSSEQKLIYSIEKYPKFKIDNVLQFEHDSQLLEKIKKSDAEIIAFDYLENEKELNDLLYLSNSGRLVIACLTKNKAIEVLNFVTKSNIALNLVVDNLTTILSQRILKKNCAQCLSKIDVNKKWLKLIKQKTNNIALNRWYASLGCPACNYSAKDKNLACFELMGISKNASLKPGFEPLIYDAVNKANNGLFSPEEISQLLK